MSTIEWPDHLLSLEEWEKLPEDERFSVELVEGVLALSPRPLTLHQRAIRTLLLSLTHQLPRRLEALPEVEVLLGETPLTIRIPDVVVVDKSVGDQNLPRLAATEIHLLIQVLSDGTRRVDRVTKFAEYAEAGIPRYWLVDLTEPVTLTAYVLVDGTYALDGGFAEPATLRVADVEVRLDPATLIAREC